MITHTHTHTHTHTSRTHTHDTNTILSYLMRLPRSKSEFSSSLAILVDMKMVVRVIVKIHPNPY